MCFARPLQERTSFHSEEGSANAVMSSAMVKARGLQQNPDDGRRFDSLESLSIFSTLVHSCVDFTTNYG